MKWTKPLKSTKKVDKQSQTEKREGLKPVQERPGLTRQDLTRPDLIRPDQARPDEDTKSPIDLPGIDSKKVPAH